MNPNDPLFILGLSDSKYMNAYLGSELGKAISENTDEINLDNLDINNPLEPSRFYVLKSTLKRIVVFLAVSICVLIVVAIIASGINPELTRNPHPIQIQGIVGEEYNAHLTSPKPWTKKEWDDAIWWMSQQSK